MVVSQRKKILRAKGKRCKFQNKGKLNECLMEEKEEIRKSKEAWVRPKRAFLALKRNRLDPRQNDQDEGTNPA
jgi:hypothetical protein